MVIYNNFSELFVLDARVLLGTDSRFSFEGIVLGIGGGFRVTMPCSVFLDFEAAFGPPFLYLRPFNKLPEISCYIFDQETSAEWLSS